MPRATHDDLRFVPPRSPALRPGAVGGTRHNNRLAKVRALCEGALPLFLTAGLDRVSVHDITTAAGLPKGSFYRYVSDKTELIAAILEPVAGPTAEALDATARALQQAQHPDELRAAYAVLITQLVQTLPQHQDVVRLFLQERHGPPSESRAPVHALQAELEQQAVRLTEAAMCHGLLQPADPQVSALVFLGAATELVHHHLCGAGLRDPFAAATLLVQLALEGLSPSTR
jgi:AcrR family transcriptional regulator